MNEHAGPACVLSVIIVAIFAILLHEKSPHPAEIQANNPSASRSNPTGVDKVIQDQVQEIKRPDASRNLPAARPSTKSVGISTPRSVDAPSPSPDPRRLISDQGVPKRPADRNVAVSTKLPFAVVGQGETLADVAARVYRSRDAKEAIWKANRDQLERVDSPLIPRTLLRTP